MKIDVWYNPIFCETGTVVDGVVQDRSSMYHEFFNYQGKPLGKR